MNEPNDSLSLPNQELAILQFWRERNIYEKSLQSRKDAPPFVFYEGQELKQLYYFAKTL